MELRCHQKYLLLPISFYAKEKRLCFYHDGVLVYDLMVKLDQETPDFLLPINIQRFQGQTLHLSCEGMTLDFTCADSFPDPYAGKYRPLAHFTAQRGWLNDPNGLVWMNGQYWMFFQHNPAGTTWENCHWGLAVSPDLMHWQEQDIALYPDSEGTIFSGSGILDSRHVSGLGDGKQSTMLCFYTSAGDTSLLSRGKPYTQCLAFSTDGGHTLQRYAGNPVLPQLAWGNRDPKIVYDPASDRYVMALYLEGHDFALFRSDDLLHWSELQRLTLEEDAECPDFYPLPVDGDPTHTRWVFSAASDRYLIGRFDGQRFTPETPLLRLNWGNAFYAAQSWSHAPQDRRIRTAFFSITLPGMPFGSCMAIPQEMSLRTVNGAIRLCAQPVPELANLATSSVCLQDVSLSAGQPFQQSVSSRCCDITLRLSAAVSFTLQLWGLTLTHHAPEHVLRCLDREAPVQGMDGILTLRIILDTLTAEIFADDGSVFLGLTYVQDANWKQLTLTTDAPATVTQLQITQLHPFWA